MLVMVLRRIMLYIWETKRDWEICEVKVCAFIYV